MEKSGREEGAGVRTWLKNVGKTRETGTAAWLFAGRGGFLPWAAVAALFALAAFGGLLYSMDGPLCDALYQKRRTVDGRIAVVGIDERALEALGPFQNWDRELMARILEYLNASPDARPAVIGLDVLYSGETDPVKDGRLAEAVGVGNVVTAAAAGFGRTVEFLEDGTVEADEQAVLSYEEPYPALKAGTAQGHINAMYDRDGILRRALLELELPDGRRIPSFALAVASLYLEQEGEQPPERPPTDSRGFWYLDFAGQPGDYYEYISVADLLDKSVPAEYFADRIVLIGPYAAGLQDQYITSANHAQPMYGVEIQANAVQALLEGNYKQEAPGLAQAAVLFAAMLFAAHLFRSRGLRSCIALWALLCGGCLWAAKAAYDGGLVLHALWTPLGITVMFAGAVGDNYLRNALEKRRVTSTFKRYVAPEIVDEILKQGAGQLELGGRLCEIAVLFVDIRGFTSMSEVLTPPQVVEVLNRYLSLTASCIMENGGTLDKFIGDAAMAFWGAPLPDEDFVMNAVRAALDMREGAAGLGRELEAQFGRSVSFGIGIHTGPAVVGNIGASSRMDYTAIGDTVNTASRLEANAPGGAIYISRAVADALGDRIQAASLGEIRLKGKADGFEVLRLLGLAQPPE
ncbi:adenylate/guanylate cyclase domain-containing protein [Enterocloster asparagiformis]|uniref:adenylate/guanylate cyclase domain-containing protein n=1 Tax=Enterocloster asparagiformis TaxID=333367 RepID=UPI002A7EEE9B|nr:adenylate/guanylate cyclase domain-containing protein [Enterocloster asparagiformis]